MADKLILHIGATKTGTSAIQSALARNRGTLLAHGIVYPAGRTDAKALEGRVTGGNGTIFRGLYDAYGESPSRALRIFERQLRRAAAEPKAQTVVFSHERSGGADPRVLAELKKVFARHFEQVQVIYYVRHLADHAMSQYSEFVRRRRMKGRFDDFAPTYRARFKRTIENYESVFERSDIQYVLYDEVRDRLYRDFLQRIGAPAALNLAEPEQVNRSLTADEIEIIRRINTLRLTRGLVTKIVEDYTFRNAVPRPGRLPVGLRSIETVGENNRDVIECVNQRLGEGAVLRVASDGLLAAARSGAETEERALDPQIMMRILESGMRVLDARDRERQQWPFDAVMAWFANLRDWLPLPGRDVRR